MFGSKSSGDKWPIKYLSEIVDPNCPISYGIVQPGDELEDGVPIVRPVDLNSNYYVYKNGLKRTTEAISNSYKRTILRGDELLLCVRGTTGVMGLATEELKGGNVTRGITPLYFKEGFNRIYLLGAFLSDDVQAYIKDNTVGSTLKGINMERVRKIQIPIPPIEIQNKWEEVFKQADKSKFMRSKSQFIEMFGGNKVDYVQLSSLCSTFIDGDWIESKDQSESGIRLIQTGNVGCGEYKDKGDKAKYITEDTFNKLHCTEIYPGDILISRLPDPVGRACVLPEGLGKCVTAVDCTIIRFSEKILPNFFVAYTNTPEYLTQIKSTLAGTTRLRVSRGNLGKVKIPVPSIEQQRTFVSIAEQADKSKLIGLLWKHCHCRDVYTK